MGVVILYCSAFAGIAESAIKDSAETANAIRFMMPTRSFKRIYFLLSGIVIDLHQRSWRPQFIGNAHPLRQARRT